MKQYHSTRESRIVRLGRPTAGTYTSTILAVSRGEHLFFANDRGQIRLRALFSRRFTRRAVCRASTTTVFSTPTKIKIKRVKTCDCGLRGSCFVGGYCAQREKKKPRYFNRILILPVVCSTYVCMYVAIVATFSRFISHSRSTVASARDVLSAARIF